MKYYQMLRTIKLEVKLGEGVGDIGALDCLK
jgi:hypothetical protein